MRKQPRISNDEGGEILRRLVGGHRLNQYKRTACSDPQRVHQSGLRHAIYMDLRKVLWTEAFEAARATRRACLIQAFESPPDRDELNTARPDVDSDHALWLTVELSGSRQPWWPQHAGATGGVSDQAIQGQRATVRSSGTETAPSVGAILQCL